MKRGNLLILVLLALALLFTGVLFAQRPPARNVSPRRHPNLAAAQRHCAQAYQKTVDAQKANEWDLGGHAQKAKELLDQASHELKLAAEASNADKK